MNTSGHGTADLHSWFNKIVKKWNDAEHMILSIPINTGSHYVVLTIQKFSDRTTQAYIMDSQDREHYNHNRIKIVELMYNYVDNKLNLNPRKQISNNPHNPHDGKIEWLAATMQTDTYECGLNAACNIALFEKLTKSGRTEIDMTELFNESQQYSYDKNLVTLMLVTREDVNPALMRRIRSENKEDDVKQDDDNKDDVKTDDKNKDDEKKEDGKKDVDAKQEDVAKKEDIDAKQRDAKEEGKKKGGEEMQDVDDVIPSFLELQKRAQDKRKSVEDDSDLSEDGMSMHEIAHTKQQPTERKQNTETDNSSKNKNDNNNNNNNNNNNKNNKKNKTQANLFKFFPKKQ